MKNRNKESTLRNTATIFLEKCFKIPSSALPTSFGTRRPAGAGKTPFIKERCSVLYCLA
uniref:Uncharacterized protein n=1 Tax=Arundo donax TaxID=35708 RepID=A0A0A9EU30_ARUDO